MKNKLNRQNVIQLSAVAICLFLILTTLTVYGHVQRFDFVNYDDDDYVYDNPHVQNGVTFDSTVWAFTTRHASNWHPLTWLSHMLDCQMFGLWAGGHHLTSLFFHILNVLLLFFVFQKTTGKIWQSGFMAALFALHPLHVQSVAWVSERKDVLSAFFWMLTLLAYIRYVRRPRWSAYMLVLLFFVSGLMSKPMVITLPFVLLLLDYWPLNRICLNGPAHKLYTKNSGVIREKIPLFILSAISVGITFYVQQQGGAVKSLDVVPLSIRLTNALLAYVGYIIKTVWPVKMAAFYPYPDMLPWWKIIAAAMILAALTGVAIRLRHKRPYIIVGWLWFAGTLVPVIGLVQVGIQSMADRYMYLPMIGLLIIVARGIPELVSNCRYNRHFMGISAIIALAVLSCVTWKQAGYWKNSVILFSHAIAVTENNFIAHANLGLALSMNHQLDAAIDHYQKSLAINPVQSDVYMNLGLALERKGNFERALNCLQQSVLIDPEYQPAQYNLGTYLFKKERFKQAIPHLQKAVELAPDNAEAQFNLANSLFRAKRYDEALIHAQKTIALNPDHEKARQLAGTILFIKKQWDQSLSYFDAVLDMNPKSTVAYYFKGLILLRQDKFQAALVTLKKGLMESPNNTEIRNLMRQLETKLANKKSLSEQSTAQ